MIAIITSDTVYMFKRKEIRFWLVVLECKLKKIEYEVIEE